VQVELKSAKPLHSVETVRDKDRKDRSPLHSKHSPFINMERGEQRISEKGSRKQEGRKKRKNNIETHC